MANKALGRDLGDLLSQARPARIAGIPAPASTPAESDSPESAGGPPPSVKEASSSTGADPAERASDSAAPSLPFDSGVGVNEVPAAGEPATGGASPGRTRSVYRRTVSAPAANPASPRRSPWFFVLLAGDGVLLALAAVLAFGGWMQRPWAKATAVGALVVGGAMSAIAVTLPRREVAPSRDKDSESRVRVHLTRV